MKFALLVIAFLLSAHANADESVRKAKIAKIMEAQGLQQMLQQQLDQSKASSSELGKSLYRKILSESGIAEGQQNPKLEQVLIQYIERCSTMFSAKEFVDIFSRFYGKNLSDSELDKILAYYKSSVGKKDVAATQVAMTGLSQVMAVESQKRMNESIGQLTADIKAAMANPPINTDAQKRTAP